MPIGHRFAELFWLELMDQGALKSQFDLSCHRVQACDGAAGDSPSSGAISRLSVSGGAGDTSTTRMWMQSLFVELQTVAGSTVEVGFPACVSPCPNSLFDYVATDCRIAGCGFEFRRLAR
jgi:hypothetical protein